MINGPRTVHGDTRNKNVPLEPQDALTLLFNLPGPTRDPNAKGSSLLATPAPMDLTHEAKAGIIAEYHFETVVCAGLAQAALTADDRQLIRDSLEALLKFDPKLAQLCAHLRATGGHQEYRPLGLDMLRRISATEARDILSAILQSSESGEALRGEALVQLAYIDLTSARRYARSINESYSGDSFSGQIADAVINGKISHEGIQNGNAQCLAPVAVVSAQICLDFNKTNESRQDAYQVLARIDERNQSCFSIAILAALLRDSESEIRWLALSEYARRDPNGKHIVAQAMTGDVHQRVQLLALKILES